MRELTKSMISFSWSMSLFGVKQLTNVLTLQNPSQSTGKAAAAFDAVTHATEDQFGDVFKVTFQAGDQLQRDVVNLMFSSLTLKAFSPNNIMRLTSATMQQLVETSRVFIPGQDSLVAWRELMNKLQVFLLVKEVNKVLQIPSGTDIPLIELTERSYALGPYPALWAVEGLGHYYGDTFWARNEVPQNILTDESVSDLPDKSLLMLHAGIGLSFANYLLKPIYSQSPVSEIRDVLQRFVTLCQENSREGYVGAAYESLGLVTRTFHPQMIDIVDEQLSEIDPEVVGYYWHGVGRALYFFLTYFVPGSCSPWRAAKREAPHELALSNIIAGLGWAVAMVNIRNPEIMQSLLKHHGDQLSANDAFSNGVASSIIMRYDTTPDAPFTTPFYQYQPHPHKPGLVKLWKSQVEEPCRAALQHYYPVLKKHNRLDEIFRYQSLSELVDRLKGDSGADT